MFFFGALILAMILMHPGYLACSVLFSNLYLQTVRRNAGFAGRMLLLFLAATLINPLFSVYGDTVLFCWPGGRRYTLEALLYGMAVAAMVVSVFTWFAAYSVVMTSDKFLYLFGKMAPSATLVLTMVLRLLPSYKRKLDQMNSARRGIGMSADGGTRLQRAEHGAVLLSALVSWALEGGVTTADSMQSRGFGCGKRSSFSLYRFEMRDKCLLALMLLLLLAVALCGFRGGAAASYAPRFEAAGCGDFRFLAGVSAYAAFLAIPSAVNILEEIRWRSLRSKM